MCWNSFFVKQYTKLLLSQSYYQLGKIQIRKFLKILYQIVYSVAILLPARKNSNPNTNILYIIQSSSTGSQSYYQLGKIQISNMKPKTTAMSLRRNPTTSQEKFKSFRKFRDECEPDGKGRNPTTSQEKFKYDKIKKITGSQMIASQSYYQLGKIQIINSIIIFCYSMFFLSQSYYQLGKIQIN